MVRCLARYVEILTIWTGGYRCRLHNTEPGLAAAATANICFFLWRLDQQSRWMECLTFLFVPWRWVESASFTLSTAQLSLTIVTRLVLHLSAHLVCCLLPPAWCCTFNILISASSDAEFYNNFRSSVFSLL